jgi:hypothetical protein
LIPAHDTPHPAHVVTSVASQPAVPNADYGVTQQSSVNEVVPTELSGSISYGDLRKAAAVFPDSEQ